MATFTLQTITGPLADYLVAQLDTPANTAAIEAAIGKDEAAAVAALTAFLKGVPLKGVLSLIAGPVESALESYAQSLVAQYGPTVVFALIDAEAHNLAKELGG